MEAVFETLRDMLSADVLTSGGWVARAGGGDVVAPPRYWWPYLLGALAIACAVHFVQRRRGAGPKRTLLAYLFPRRIWTSASIRVDFKLFLANLLFGVTRVSMMTAWTAVLVMILGIAAPAAPSAPLSWQATLFIGVVLALAFDFSEWLAHWAAHRFPLLWAFHRVHHSAEVMTPFTASRLHPVEIILEQMFAAVVVAPVLIGIWLVFGQIDLWLVFGVNAVYVVSLLSFTHLRHSHVWLNFPKPLCWIFSSPAQHQIHHSRHPRHWDRNFGELFAFWDLMFGTLYQPEGKERLVLGLAPEDAVHRPRPHQTLVDALVEPFFYLLRRHRARNTPQSTLNPPSLTPVSASELPDTTA